MHFGARVVDIFKSLYKDSDINTGQNRLMSTPVVRPDETSMNVYGAIAFSTILARQK